MFSFKQFTLLHFLYSRSIVIRWTHKTDSDLKFQHPFYYGEVQENSTKLLSITIVSVIGSQLNEHIVYSILNPSPAFEISPTSGVITTTGVPFDREAIDHYLLIVQVSTFITVRNLLSY